MTEQATAATGAVNQCTACAYDLTGIPSDGVCPECGFAVENYIMANASGEYISTLHQGLKLIIYGVIAQIALLPINMIVNFASRGMSATVATVLGLLMAAVGLAISIAILVGWWKFSEPDPAYAGARDGSTARKWLRIAVMVSAGATAVSILGYLLLFVVAPVGAIIVLLAGLASAVASIVQLFASILYVKWMAPRLQSGELYKTAKRNLWLVPLLYLFFFLLIPAIIGLVLYISMLNNVKKLLEGVMGGAPAPAPAPAAT